MEPISKLGPFQALAQFWNTLTNTQRFVTAVFISLSVVLLIVVSVVATRPQMTVLFSGLQAEDAGAIVSKLQENKCPYEIEGSTIKVPERNVHEMRMQLASQGLPQGGNVGFEIFDKSNLGMTEFEQRVKYRQALQGELSRTINQLDRVMASRVHIAIPEPSVFSDKEQQATASVTLKLRPGSNLTSEQVGGIVHLVSSAVEGLHPNRVTVVDTSGNMLSESTDENTGLDPRLSASQLKLKREHEQVMEKNIQTMLERVLGPNKAIVRVNAKINFDRTEMSSETYQPLGGNKGVLSSEETLSETYNGNAGTVGGVAGMSGNIRPSVTTTRAGEGGYQRTETTNKYEVSKTSEHVVKAPGQVESLSVAVMVDRKVDQAQIPAIRNAVATACGIDPTDMRSGNKITVESIEFDNSTMKKAEEEMAAVASRSTYMSVGKTVGAILLLLVFLFFLKSILKQVKVSVPAASAPQEVTPGQAAAGTQAYAAAANQQPAPVNLSQLGPEEVAQTLRRWISES